MACCHFIERAQDTQPTRIEITLEPSAAPGMLGAFLWRAVLACEEAGGKRIIVDDAEFLLPADRLEFGLEFLAVGEVIEWLQALVAWQAEFLAGRKRGLSRAGLMFEAPIARTFPAAISCA